MSMNQKYDILVEFNDVQVGTVAKKTLHIHDLTKNFTVKRFTPYEHMKLIVFKAKKLKTDSFTIDISYYPTVSFLNHVGYFQLIDDNEIRKVICAKGNCIGPTVTLSTKFLDFYRYPNKKEVEKIIEITNNSLIPTKFQMSIDNTNCVFTCAPFYGDLPGKKHHYIKIRFRPKKHGSYYLQLVCLILNQEPQIIEAYGLYSNVEDADYAKLQKHTPVTFSHSFKIFTKREVYDKRQNNVLSIKNQNLDFGNTYSAKFKPVLTTYLHNVSDKCIIVNFDNDTDTSVTTFEVNQKFWQLFPGEIIEVDVKFSPPHEDAFYSHSLYGRVFLFESPKEAEIIRKGEISYFPLPFHINAIGYSFRNNYSWIPQVQNPKLVVLPFTLNNYLVFNTFLIESQSNLPIMFKIKPSADVKDTFYSVKPEQGIIHGHSQIIVVKFDPRDIEENCIVTEEWEIEYNGPEMDRRKIIFKTSVELPFITFGDNNKIDFDFIYPGCRKKQTIMMINNTCHNYMFEFIKLYEVQADPPVGTIRACEAVRITFSYKAEDETLCLRTLECAFRRLLRFDVLYGQPIIFTLQVIGSTAYGKLCALPRSHDLGEIECLEERTTTFTLFNYGQSDINYKLVYVTNDDYDYLLQDPKWIAIDPEVDTVVSRGSVKVTVKIHPAHNGTFKGCFRYQIRLIEDSDEIVDNKNPIWPDGDVIFELTYRCFYPTLQFASIVDNTCGPLFGKIDLWEMLKMKQLNHLLASTKHGETKLQYLRMPDAEHGLHIKKQIVFVLENDNNIPTVCKFVRKKICDCVLEEKRLSLSKTEKVYNCPHRALFNVRIQHEEIMARSFEYVTMDLSYNMEGLQTVCFQMLLSQNRCIQLMFKMMGLKPDGSVLSPYTWNLKFVMQEIYVNIKRPGLQAYWFYNNTRQSAQYNFDTTILNEINQKYGRTVLKCMNPCGTLEPKSYCPIYFRFDPVNLKQFDIMIPLMYACQNYRLNLICKGVPYFYSPINDLSGMSLGLKDFYYPDARVTLSQEKFVIGPVLTFTRVTRLFFMKNVHKQHTMGYTFEQKQKRGILELSVSPPKGLLRPQETISCILKVCTFGNPSSTRSLLTCFLVNYTQLQEHIQSKEAYTKMGLQLQHEFTISDDKNAKKKTKMPHNPVQIIPPPKVFQVSMSIIVDIASIADRDIKISLRDQLSITPYREMFLYRRCQLELLIPDASCQDRIITSTLADYDKKISKNLKIKMIHKRPKRPRCDDCKDRKTLKRIPKDEEFFIHVHTAMEGIIGDLLQSEIFENLIKEITELQPLYYAQFKHEPGSEIRMLKVREILNMPPNWLISMLMEKIILDCLLKYFNFENMITPTHISFNYEHEQEIPNDGSSSLTVTSSPNKANILKDIYTERFMFLLDNL